MCQVYNPQKNKKRKNNAKKEEKERKDCDGLVHQVYNPQTMEDEIMMVSGMPLRIGKGRLPKNRPLLDSFVRNSSVYSGLMRALRYFVSQVTAMSQKSPSWRLTSWQGSSSFR